MAVSTGPVRPLPSLPGGPVNAASTGNTPAIQGTSFVSKPTDLQPFPGLGSGPGVVGASGAGVGVVGTSTGADAINGTSSSPAHAGVSANNDGGGFGLWAKAKTAGYFEGDGNFAIQAVCASDVDAINATSGSAHHAAVAGDNGGGGFAFWGASDSKGGIGIFARGTRQAAEFIQTDSASDLDALVSTTSSTGHAAVAAHNNGGGFGLWASSMVEPGPEQPSAGGVGIYAEGHTYAAHFKGPVFHEGDHHCTGTLTVDKDIALPAGAGDCAEEFDIAPSAEAAPGTVMVLTGNGVLEPSESAYDKKVAGVISGAGEYRPGMVLDRQGSSENRRAIALVGKVFCKVDAQYGAIEVGDLLTTSATPGHAMKATDPLRVFGSVIGKALRALPSGKGQIPVLIALQ